MVVGVQRPSTTASDEVQDLHQAAKQLYLNHLPDYAGASALGVFIIGRVMHTVVQRVSGLQLL